METLGKMGRPNRKIPLTSPSLRYGESLMTQKTSTFEQSREQRIKENRERMEKRVIWDLSIELNSSGPPPRSIRRKNPNVVTPKSLSMGPLEPILGSSRYLSLSIGVCCSSRSSCYPWYVYVYLFFSISFIYVAFWIKLGFQLCLCFHRVCFIFVYL